MTITTGISVEEFLDGDYPPGSWLVDGEVIMNDPTFRHQEICLRILVAVRAWCQAGAGRGVVGYGGNWVLGPGQVYKPDVWWATEDHRPDGARSDVRPDIAAEVRSPGTWRLDIGRKRAVYEAAGVPELWLVDQPASTVIVLGRSSQGSPTFDVDAEYGPGTTLTTPLLDRFALAVDDLFA